MRTANVLTDSRLRRQKWSGADEWISDGGSRGSGRLVAKVAQAGIAFYYAYFDGKRQWRFLALGKYDPTGERGLTLLQARTKATELSSLYRAGDYELHERIAHESEQKILARRAAREAAERAEQMKRDTSLRRLLEAYHGHLARQGKQSAADVRRIFERHVYAPWPDLAAKRAADVSVDELVALLGRLTEAGRGRTAAKLRSYLRAAYALAIRSKTDPDAPMTLRTFGIAANPVASIGALSKYNRARDRVLSIDEMRHYLRRVSELSAGPRRDALLLSLRLGGQRIAQLLRVRPADLDLNAKTMALYDGKGARRQPRRHLLPLSREAVEIVAPRLEVSGDAFLFTHDGKRAVYPSNVSAEVSEVSKAMLKARESREPFELRDVRRTCETMLAALGVSSDVRAQIQSHGLGGVQQRHYDRHDYMPEKRRALDRWQRRLREIAEGQAGGEVIEASFGS